MFDDKLNELYIDAKRIVDELNLTNKFLGNMSYVTIAETRQAYCKALAQELIRLNNGKEPTQTERNTQITSGMVKWNERWKEWAKQEGYDSLC